MAMLRTFAAGWLFLVLTGCTGLEDNPVGVTSAGGSQADGGSAGTGAAGKGTGGKGGQPGAAGAAVGGGTGGTSDAGAGGDPAYGGSGGSGSIHFGRVLDSPGEHVAFSVASVADGSIWFGGGVKGTLTIDDLSVSGPEGTSAAQSFLGKLDRYGHAQLLEPLAAPSQYLFPYRLAPAPDGGVYALMLQRGESDLGLGSAVGADQFGAVVVRFAPDGKPVWQQLVDAGGKNEYPVYSALAVTPDGGVVASAPVQHTVKRFGPTGEVLWEQHTPESFGGSALTVATTVLLSGTASSGELGGLGSFTAKGERDGMVLALDLATGQLVSQRSLGSAGARTTLLATAVEPDGSLLVGGSFGGSFAGLPTSADHGPQALWARLPAGGGEPAWVRTAPLEDQPTENLFAYVPEVMIDAEGGEHVVLLERGTFDVGLGPHTSTSFQNVGDVFVLDLGADGAVARQRFIASGAENDVGRYELQAQADADGLVMAGGFRVKSGTALGPAVDAGGKEVLYVTRLTP